MSPIIKQWTNHTIWNIWARIARARWAGLISQSACVFMLFYVWCSIYLYGISLKLLWLCECGTRLESLTPEMANSCAEPDKLRSLPLLRDKAPHPTPELWFVCCWRSDWFGAFVVDAFFFVGPNPKNLHSNLKKCNITKRKKEITNKPRYSYNEEELKWKDLE